MKKHLRYSILYSALQGAYWMLYCSVFIFATVFLLEKGFKDGEIGIILAAGNILGVLLQPYFASLADRSKRLSLQRLIRILSLGGILLLILLLMLPHARFGIALLFLMANAIVQILQPLINSVSIYYTNRGIPIDFGIARGIGSVSFAAASFALGLLVKRFHAPAILISGAVFLAAILLTSPLLPVLKEAPAVGKTPTLIEEEEEALRAPAFLLRYKGFLFLLLGITLLFTSHTILNNYLIQIVRPLGGSPEDLGNALSLAALMELPAMFLFSKIVKRFGSSSLLRFSAIVFTVKFALVTFAGSLFLIYASQILQGGAFAVCTPASIYYVNRLMREEDKFKGQAVLVGTNTLGGVFGSLAGGALLEAFQVKTTLFFGLAVSLAGTLLVLFSVHKKENLASPSR